MNPGLLKTIQAAFDAPRAIERAARIHRTDRLFTFPAFDRTARTVTAMMERLGLDDIRIETYPADGRRIYGDWQAPRGWDVRAASLAVRRGRTMLTIADRRRDPCGVIMYSAPTPGRRAVNCRIVPAARTADWPGNLVWLENPGQAAPADLARRGALGLVTDHMPLWLDCRTRDDVYDITLWNNSYLAPANSHGLVGFQLTPRMGDLVRGLFRTGGADCLARVDARLYDGSINFITGRLAGDGTTAEEVAVFAHLFEPGAHDNASGCAMGLEALAALQALIAQGTLPPPRRSLRLCFTMEIVGTLAYAEAHPDHLRRIVAGVNPDMVGADMEAVKSRLHLYGTPDSVPSYVETLLGAYVEEAFRPHHLLRWSERPYFINDNFITDPSIGIPCPALVCLRDTYYHTSADTPDRLSPVTMQAIGGALTAYIYEIGRGDGATARRLVDLVLARELARLARTDLAAGIPVRDLLTYQAQTACRRLAGIAGFAAEPRSARAVSGWIRAAQGVVRSVARQRACQADADRLDPAWREAWAPPVRLRRAAGRIFPRKKIAGTFSYAHLPPAEQAGAPADASWNYRANAPVYWADGRRSLLEVWRNACLEFGVPVPLAAFMDTFAFLERNGFVEYL
ncbi:MAG: DUF4910 domain-containing protein [Planctomycetota bacterium]